ncbi:MAG TPA: orotate phosphoribosyltransferase-like protein [Methanothermococcus okinawensis]|uniref:Transcriptional regulator GfcR n=1 Tax=Methanothermococcus okinawensis TaxID=155863 RepID=A0A832YNJ3_9EURY|nr:orotate phosphoribosyltransferase-like protein [Methanothermococcus okinawensis]
MKKSLIKKALKLRDAGLSTVDIAEELNTSVDTALYLILNGEKLLKEPEEKINKIESRTDIFVNWDNVKTSSKRLKNITSIMCDMLNTIDFDVILGISTGGVPLATLMSEKLDKNFSIYIPKKHLHGNGKTGFVGHNYQDMENKNIVIVDDVMTSGNTMRETINYIKNIGNPKGAIVVIDKSGIEEIGGIPIKALFRVGTVELIK